MNVEIGTETPIFLFWEYLFTISVFCLCSAYLTNYAWLPTGNANACLLLFSWGHPFLFHGKGSTALASPPPLPRVSSQVQISNKLRQSANLELSWPRIQKTRRWQPVTALNPQIYLILANIRKICLRCGSECRSNKTFLILHCIFVSKKLMILNYRNGNQRYNISAILMDLLQDSSWSTYVQYTEALMFFRLKLKLKLMYLILRLNPVHHLYSKYSP